jgi:hypothetical protein
MVPDYISQTGRHGICTNPLFRRAAYNKYYIQGHASPRANSLGQQGASLNTPVLEWNVLDGMSIAGHPRSIHRTERSS